MISLPSSFLAYLCKSPQLQVQEPFDYLPPLTIRFIFAYFYNTAVALNIRRVGEFCVNYCRMFLSFFLVCNFLVGMGRRSRPQVVGCWINYIIISTRNVDVGDEGDRDGVLWPLNFFVEIPPTQRKRLRCNSVRIYQRYIKCGCPLNVCTSTLNFAA